MWRCRCRPSPLFLCEHPARWLSPVMTALGDRGRRIAEFSFLPCLSIYSLFIHILCVCAHTYSRGTGRADGCGFWKPNGPSQLQVLPTTEREPLHPFLILICEPCVRSHCSTRTGYSSACPWMRPPTSPTVNAPHGAGTCTGKDHAHHMPRALMCLHQGPAGWIWYRPSPGLAVVGRQGPSCPHQGLPTV